MAGAATALRRVAWLPALFCGLAAAACYTPNGTLFTNQAFQPCNQVLGQHSMCCGTNWTAVDPKVAPDVCLPNGLCQNYNTYSNGQTVVIMWRQYCTDPTWQSPYCLKDVCTTGSTVSIF